MSPDRALLFVIFKLQSRIMMWRENIQYEKYTQGVNANKGHTYGVGPDVGIGAPNVARKSSQYDPAAAMFNYADVNSDGKIDQQEFGSFMRSV